MIYGLVTLAVCVLIQAVMIMISKKKGVTKNDQQRHASP
jgi:hypothetical protein